MKTSNAVNSLHRKEELHVNEETVKLNMEDPSSCVICHESYPLLTEQPQTKDWRRFIFSSSVFNSDYAQTPKLISKACKCRGSLAFVCTVCFKKHYNKKEIKQCEICKSELDESLFLRPAENTVKLICKWISVTVLLAAATAMLLTLISVILSDYFSKHNNWKESLGMFNRIIICVVLTMCYIVFIAVAVVTMLRGCQVKKNSASNRVRIA